MRRSTERILATHVGSLARPHDLLAGPCRPRGGNVIASADCGFSSRATFAPEVHPTVVWAKFAALAEGAAIASRRLWGASEVS
jgi:hypothetical protein